MGTITVSDRDCSILNMPLFHACGVVPTSEAISPTFVLTVLNSPDRLPMMPSIIAFVFRTLGIEPIQYLLQAEVFSVAQFRFLLQFLHCHSRHTSFGVCLS